MSADKQDNPVNSSNTTSPAAVSQANTGADVIDANSGSPFNAILWILALASFIAATLVNQYLPAYWQPASSVWVRIGIIAALVVFGILCFFFTQQGKGFTKLVSDSQTELRRVTWPNREETFEYTWKTLVVMIITGVLIWILDGVFNVLVGAIIGS